MSLKRALRAAMERFDGDVRAAAHAIGVPELTARRKLGLVSKEAIEAWREKTLLSIDQATFLAVYAETGMLSKAADAAGVGIQRHFVWLEESTEYARRFGMAEREMASRMVDELVRRAHVGVLEPVYYKGEPVGAIRKFSDPLLLKLVSALDERFRDKRELRVGPIDDGALLRRFADAVAKLRAAREGAANGVGGDGGGPGHDRPALPAPEAAGVPGPDV
jgi:hypothetical protein